MENTQIDIQIGQTVRWRNPYSGPNAWNRGKVLDIIDGLAVVELDEYRAVEVEIEELEVHP